MKWNIYSKLWIIFFVLMGAACTNQVEDAIPMSDQPIEFSVQSDWKEIPNTRENAGREHFKENDEIQIFGFHKYSSDEVQKFMYRVDDSNRGQKVKFDGKNWSYSPKRFWPKEGTLDFYAGYPEYSVIYDKTGRKCYRQQDANPLQLDLLWGESTGHDCTKPNSVSITMKHALAKVIINLDKSLRIKQADVSAYNVGHFDKTDTDRIPDWDVEKTSNNIWIAHLYPSEGQNTMTDATVFILPDKITRLILTKPDGARIDVSEKIKELTFDAGKQYNLKIKSIGDEVFADDANCYILNPPTTGEKTFEIPIRRIDTFWGNKGYENVPDNTLGTDKSWTATILWKQMAEGDVSDANLVKNSGTGTGTGFRFKVAAGTSGNVVVGVKNSQGTILWSWHLWLTDYVPNNSNVAMDRNLGALGTSFEENGRIYYQFGRKDPFPGSYPGGVFSAATTSQTVAYSVMNPMVFVYIKDKPWTTEERYNPTNENIVWQDPKVIGEGKSIFDPSPAGWKIPADSYWENVAKSGLTWQDNCVMNDDYTFYANGYFKDKYSVEYSGEKGYYWSSTVADDKIKGSNLYFQSSGVQTNANSRSIAMSVRCVPE